MQINFSRKPSYNIIVKNSLVLRTEWYRFTAVNRLFRRQRVSSQTISSPTYEVEKPTSNISTPTLMCQFANVQNTFWNRSETCNNFTNYQRRTVSSLMLDKLFVSAWKCSFHSPQSLSRHFDNTPRVLADTLVCIWKFCKPSTASAFICRERNACKTFLLNVCVGKSHWVEIYCLMHSLVSRA